MPTVVVYNGVEIHNAQTRVWETSAARDRSDTDIVFHKFRFVFEGILHVQPDKQHAKNAPAWIGPESGDEMEKDTAAANYRYYSRLLLEARKFLQIYFSNDMAFRAMPPTTEYHDYVDVDVNNGPKPINVALLEIISDRLLRVSFEIECAKVLCIEGEPPSLVSDVLNNRWSIAEEMDDKFVTTRTIRGQMRMAFSDPSLIGTRAIGHANRALILPPLEDGFRRERMHMDVTPDGLFADYTIIDRQTDTAAPWPATKIEGQISYSGQLGGKEATLPTLHCLVRLYGSPGCHVRTLLFQAMRVLDARMRATSQNDNKKWWPFSVRLSEVFGELPVVEAEMVAQDMRAGGGKDITAMGIYLAPEQLGQALIMTDWVGQTYDRKKSPLPPLYGTGTGGGSRPPTVLMLLHCYLQTPCVDDHAIKRQSPGDVKTKMPERESVTISYVPEEGIMPMTDPPISQQHKESIYTMAVMQSRYLVDSLNVQLPIARAVSSNGEDEDTSVIVTLAKGQARREIMVDTERVGSWPEVPDPVESYTDGTLKGTLIKYDHTILPPRFATNATNRVYRIKGYYLYALNRPPKKDEKLRVGVLPFTSLGRADTEWQPKLSYATRLDPAAGSGEA